MLYNVRLRLSLKKYKIVKFCSLNYFIFGFFEKFKSVNK